MSNLVVSLAIIGKNNEPLYLKEFLQRNNETPARHRDLVDEGELFGLVSPKPSVNQDSTTEAEASPNSIDNDNEDATDDTTEIGPAIFESIPISLKQEFILHAALDRFEQLSGPPPGYGWRKGNTAGDGPHPMYVGLLCQVEDLRVYGYMTSTQVKVFCVIVDDPAFGVPHHSSSYPYPSSHDNSLIQTGASGVMNHHGSDMSSLGIHSPGGPHHHHSSGSTQQTDILLQRLFKALHQCYINFMLNPFTPLVPCPIVSQRFDEQIQAAVTQHNRLCLDLKL